MKNFIKNDLKDFIRRKFLLNKNYYHNFNDGLTLKDFIRKDKNIQNNKLNFTFDPKKGKHILI
jgi:hypothetical protein